MRSRPASAWERLRATASAMIPLRRHLEQDLTGPGSTILFLEHSQPARGDRPLLDELAREVAGVVADERTHPVRARAKARRHRGDLGLATRASSPSPDENPASSPSSAFAQGVSVRRAAAPSHAFMTVPNRFWTCSISNDAS
jgi:hypothetical protein